MPIPKNKTAYKIMTIWAVLLLVIFGFRLNTTGINIDTNIRSILPTNHQAEQLQTALDNLSSNFENKVILLVSAPNSKTTEEAASDLSTALLQSGLVSLDQAEQSVSAKWVFHNRNQILCESSAYEFTSESALKTWNTALAQVYGIGTPISGELLKSDPFLLTYRLADCLSENAPNVEGLVSGTLLESSSNLGTQDQLSDLLISWQNRWQDEQVSISKLGSIFYAEAGASSAKSEIAYIGGFSLLGIILLFYATFKRANTIILVASLISISFVTGFAVTCFFYPEIHIFTLLLAAMLIGVVTDYAIHVLAARGSNPESDPEASRSEVFRPLTVSMLSTIAGFSGLWLLDLTVFSQLALFAVIGIFTAWLMAQYLLIPIDIIFSEQGKPNSTWNRFSGWIALNIPSKRTLQIVACSLLVLTFGGALNATILDDITKFQPRNETLLKQEASVLAALNSERANSYLISHGNDLEAAKQAEEAAILDLGLSNFIDPIYTKYDPSQKVRDQNLSALQTHLYGNYLTKAEQILGIEYETKDFVPMSMDERPKWLASLHFIDSNDRHFLVSQWTGPTHTKTDHLIDSDLLNLHSSYSQAFKKYREITAWALLIAVSIALVIVFSVYRKLNSAFIVVCPTLALLGGIFIPCLFGFPLSFFSVAAGMVLLGIGIDYATFLWETKGRDKNWTYSAVLIAAVTSLLSMGLMSLSSTVPVQSFGLTVGVGTFCALIYSLCFVGSHSGTETK